MFGYVITIITSILLVMMTVFLVSKYQLWFIKYRLKFLSVLIILGITIYTIGYLSKSSNNYLSAGLMAVFSTGRMFVFENDISSFENNVADLPYYSIVFGLVMTFSMVTIGMIVLSFFGYRVMCRIRLRVLRLFLYNRPLYIFTQLNEEALCLSNDITKHHKKSIIIFCVEDTNEIGMDKRLENAVCEKGYFILPVYSANEIYRLCNQFSKNRIMLFANDDDDHKNASLVYHCVNSLKEARHQEKTLNISYYPIIRNKEYMNVFSKDIFSRTDLHIIDESDLISRELFNKFTPMSCVNGNDSLTICLVGYTPISENLYRYSAFLGQSQGVRLKLVLLDEEIQDKTAAFFNQNPEIGKCANFELINIKPMTTEFFRYLENHIRDFNCVISAMDDIDVLTEISRVCHYKEHDIQLCAYVKEYEKYQLVFETSLLMNVIPFGSIKDIYTENILINETLDQLAKGFHYYYSELYHDPRTWEEISLFEKQSSRALALHIQSKLYTLGLKYIVGGNTALLDEKLKDEAILEQLAKGEHLRWNAYSFANGWRTMDNLQNRVKNKDEVTKIHSCLVDWDGLDHVGECFNKNYKEMDRQLVRNMGKVLESVGFGIENADRGVNNAIQSETL